MKLTKSIWQEELEINQPVYPHSGQTYFFQLSFWTLSTLVHAKK